MRHVACRGPNQALRRAGRGQRRELRGSERGQVMSIVGPNGAGKTTVFNLITGVLPARCGDVLFERPARHRLAAPQAGRARHRPNVPEHPPVPASQCARERHDRPHGAHARGRLSMRCRDARASGPSGATTIEHAEALLDWVGVGANRFRMPGELPYGDQRRVEIARALALEPRLLILDEPTAGMVAQRGARGHRPDRPAERGRRDPAADRAQHERRDERPPTVSSSSISARRSPRARRRRSGPIRR